MIEFLHNEELMPDRYYFQLNGKSARENYIEQKTKIMENMAATDERADLVQQIISLFGERL